MFSQNFFLKSIH